MKYPCPVCTSELVKEESRPDVYFFSCPLCGDFVMTGSLVASIPKIYKGTKDAIHKLSHTIRATLPESAKISDD